MAIRGQGQEGTDYKAHKENLGGDGNILNVVLCNLSQNLIAHLKLVSLLFVNYSSLMHKKKKILLGI